MSVRALTLFRARLLVQSAVLLLAITTVSWGQVGDSAGSLTQSQVAQTVDRLRAANVDEPLVRQALEVGKDLLRAGRFPEAVELFDALARHTPSSPTVLYGRALATFNVGRVAEAEPLARAAVDAALKDLKVSGTNNRDLAQRAANALVLMAVVVAVKGDDAGALKAAQQATELAPDNFDAQMALGRVLFGMGDDVAAVRAFRAAVALMPANGQALFFLATSLEHGGDSQAALGAYRELIVKQPGMAEGHLGLGALLVKQGGVGIEEGISELRKALEINPRIYEARVTLGRALVARGRAEEAIAQLQRAVELAPHNPEPHYQLSLAYRRLGKKELAAAESAIVKQIHEARRGGGVGSAP